MSEKNIIINNGVTTLFNEEGYAEITVPSVDFVNSFFGHDYGIFPPAIRWISDTTPSAFLLERPPEVRTIGYRKVDYKISLPWTIFGIKFLSDDRVGVHAFCSSSSIQSFDDEIHVLPLPMAQEDGFIDGFSYGIKLTARRSIGSSLMQIINKMFNTRTSKAFNLDVLPDSWGGIDTSSNRKIMEHWQTYNQQQALTEVEYFTSQSVPTVGVLTSMMEEETKASTTFEYMHDLIANLNG